jgi:hypothetical protein
MVMSSGQGSGRAQFRRRRRWGGEGSGVDEEGCGVPGSLLGRVAGDDRRPGDYFDRCLVAAGPFWPNRGEVSARPDGSGIDN